MKIGQKVRASFRNEELIFTGETFIHEWGEVYVFCMPENPSYKRHLFLKEFEPTPLIDWEKLQADWNFTNSLNTFNHSQSFEWFREAIEKQLKQE